MILATGQVMDDLRAVFPQVEEHVDAVVATTAPSWSPRLACA